MLRCMMVTSPVQRKAPGNNGNTGTRGKKVICYNCKGEGHVARQCKEPKRKMDSQYFKDKALLIEAKEKGDVLDAEAARQFVARDMLQRFNMPTQTIPMLSKKPKKATNDLHKDILGTRNPGLGYMAKRAQPVLYDADTLLHPNHHPVSIWDSEEVLVHQVVSMKKMNEKPGHIDHSMDELTRSMAKRKIKH
ncbi:integrase, catalytic region, zinc finger, CCHC-type containing protein [Tanacetum coccineum]